MTTEIRQLLHQFAIDMKMLFGESLKQIIVYGSYARGDYTVFSDIDVMILTTLSDEEIKRSMNDVCDYAFDYMMDYGLDISPIVKNIDHFNAWVDNLPYYRNIRDEGVTLIA